MKKNLKFIIIGAVLILLVVGYYYYISNFRHPADQDEAPAKMTVVRELMSRNLQTNYPPTPKEVLKYYSDITVAFYSEEYSDDEFLGLADQIRQLYDDELAANTPYDQYLQNLRAEVLAYKEAGLMVTSYATVSGTDVFYFNEDGYKWARTNVAFTLRQGKNVGIAKETFVLRKDPEGHWKIFGWAVTEEDE